MKVDLVVLTLGLVLLGFASLYHVNWLDYEAPIPFSEENNIMLSDFKGYKLPSQSLDGNNEFAFIHTTIELHSNSDNSANVTAYFHPSKSYVFDKELHSPELLKHELYHFRITEYNARLLRKEISESSDPNLEHLLERFRRNERIMQAQYDEESYHGYVLGKQLDWEVFTDSCLNSLSDYDDVLVQF